MTTARPNGSHPKQATQPGRATQGKLLPETRDASPPTSTSTPPPLSARSRPPLPGSLFPGSQLKSQLCFELKGAHTDTRPSAISVAICLLISPGLSRHRPADGRANISGVEHFGSKRRGSAKEHGRVLRRRGNFFFLFPRHTRLKLLHRAI